MTSEPFRSPAYRIIAVPFEKIIPNTYNPNSVAPPEMKLLYLDKSYYMGVYSLCFHRQNIRNFVNVSSVIFGC